MKIKICCIKTPAEAEMAIRAGAHALGLVSAMPSGPGVISEMEIAAIAAIVPPEIDTFLLTSLTDIERLVAQYRRCRTTTIQLCDNLSADSLETLGNRLPEVNLVQVIHVNDAADLQRAADIEAYVDAIFLDSGQPQGESKTLGGTGQTHNWEISRRIVESVAVPVFLAGGLNATNVRQAIEVVQPFGVDLCNGVRSDDHLDQSLLKAFMAAVKGE